MARLAIAILMLKGANGDAFLNLPDSSFTSGDVTADHEWVAQSGDLLLVRNKHATLGRTVELVSIIDSQGRVMIPASAKVIAPAGQAGVWGPLDTEGWIASDDGKIDVNLVDGSNGDVVLAVLRR